MSVVSDWDNDYARIARAASQLRALNHNNNNNNNNNNRNNNNNNNNLAIDKQDILTGLDRLTHRLRNLEQSRSLSVSDLGRRRLLVQNLSQQLVSSSNNNNNNPIQSPNSQVYSRKHNNNYNSNKMNSPSGYNPPPPQGHGGHTSTISSAIRQQDEMLDELAGGVGRLKDQSKLIGEEAKMHVHLLDQMDVDVEAAQSGMEAETLRALKLKEDKSVWRLQLTIVGLTILLVILVLSGIS